MPEFEGRELQFQMSCKEDLRYLRDISEEAFLIETSLETSQRFAN